MLPFDKNKKLPVRILIELVYAKTFFKNAVPALDGVSNVLSPREIITQQRINYNRHCVLLFGQYVQTHEEHDNSMNSRTIGAIAMRPTGARQGGCYFFNLRTGKLITRNHWTECVMPRDVIDRVHSLARKKDMVGVEFRDRSGDVLSSDTDVLDDSNSGEGSSDESVSSDESSDDGSSGEDDDADITGVDDDNDDAVSASESESEETIDISDRTEEQELNARYGPRTTAYNLRPRRAPTYDVEALLAMGDVQEAKKVFNSACKLNQLTAGPRRDSESHVPDNNYESISGERSLFEILMAQYGLQKGLKLFGDKGNSAVHKEMK